MKKIYVKYFTGGGAFNDLVKFVNENNIPQTDIVSITQDGSNYTLFFYHL